MTVYLNVEDKEIFELAAELDSIGQSDDNEVIINLTSKTGEARRELFDYFTKDILIRMDKNRVRRSIICGPAFEGMGIQFIGPFPHVNLEILKIQEILSHHKFEITKRKA